MLFTLPNLLSLNAIDKWLTILGVVVIGANLVLCAFALVSPRMFPSKVTKRLGPMRTFQSLVRPFIHRASPASLANSCLKSLALNNVDPSTHLQILEFQWI